MDGCQFPRELNGTGVALFGIKVLWASDRGVGSLCSAVRLLCLPRCSRLVGVALAFPVFHYLLTRTFRLSVGHLGSVKPDWEGPVSNK